MFVCYYCIYDYDGIIYKKCRSLFGLCNNFNFKLFLLFYRK